MKNHDYRKRVELEDRIRFLLTENKKLKKKVEELNAKQKSKNKSTKES